MGAGCEGENGKCSLLWKGRLANLEDDLAPGTPGGGERGDEGNSTFLEGEKKGHVIRTKTKSI